MFEETHTHECQSSSSGSNPTTESKQEAGFEHSIQTFKYRVKEPERKHQFLLILNKAYKCSMEYRPILGTIESYFVYRKYHSANVNPMQIKSFNMFT